MTRRMIVGVAVAAVLIGGGGAAYMLTKDDDNGSSQNTSQSENQSGDNQNAFNAASTEGLEFKATISTTSGGQATQATIEHDDKGSTRYVASAGGQQTEIIYTSDAYYMCTSGSCYKYSLSQTPGVNFNPKDYEYGADKLEGYKSGAAYKGKQSCPSGSCDVWSVSGGGGTTTLYVDAGTKRITQVETSISGATSKIVYDYTDVTITIPANAQTLPTGQ